MCMSIIKSGKNTFQCCCHVECYDTVSGRSGVTGQRNLFPWCLNQQIPPKRHCTATRLHGSTLHYTASFIMTFNTKHPYVMLPSFAVFLPHLTVTTSFVLYICLIDIIPALSVPTPVKNYTIQSSDVWFGSIRGTSCHIGRAWWRCVCYESSEAWVLVVLRAPLQQWVECTVRGGECGALW
jgi:hypothetical protein